MLPVEKKEMNSVRELQTFEQVMERYRGEMVRIVDAANIMCHERAPQVPCTECPFVDIHGCILLDLKELVGEK